APGHHRTDDPVVVTDGRRAGIGGRGFILVYLQRITAVLGGEQQPVVGGLTARGRQRPPEDIHPTRRRLEVLRLVVVERHAERQPTAEQVVEVRDNAPTAGGAFHDIVRGGSQLVIAEVHRTVEAGRVGLKRP